MHNYLITQEQVNEIMKYLFTKPYGEVAQAIAESLPVKAVQEELGDDYYAHLVSAIVNHCKADSHKFDNDLRNLLRSI